MNDPKYEKLKKRVKELEKAEAEWKKTEEALRESERKYKNLVDQSPVGIAVHTEGKIVFANRAAYEIMGISDEEKILGKSVLELIHPDYREIVIRRMKEVIENGKTGEMMYEKFLRLDGKAIDVEVTAIPINYKGKPSSQVVFRDITLKRKAEETKKVIYEISKAVNTTANLNEFYKFIHYSLSKLINVENFYIALYDKSSDQLTFPYFVDQKDKPFESKKLTGTKSSCEYVIKTKKPFLRTKEVLEEKLRTGEFILRGSKAKIWLGVPLIIKNDVIGVMVLQSYTDYDLYSESDVELMEFVSGQVAAAIEAKRTEEALRESEDRFKSIFETTENIPVQGYDSNRNVIYWNPASEKTYGYSKGEAMGKKLEDLIIPEHMREKVIQDINLWVNEGVSISPSELVLRHKNGGDVNVYSSHVMITNYRGEKEMYCIDVSLTDLKKAEEEKKKLEEQLFRAQKMESIGRLAGAIAHDLNHVLTGLVTYPDLLLLEMDKDDPLRERIADIKKSGQKAAAIVHDLSTVVRSKIVDTEVLNINDIITKNIDSPELQEIKSKNPHIEIDLELDKFAGNIKSSEIHIIKILYNLIINGIDAMPDGGKLLISTVNKHIEDSIKGYEYIPKGEYVLLAVSDTGIGISKEDKEKIFEPYFTKKVLGRSGTGIGLTVVWNIVKELSGYIDVKSEVGLGTVFEIYFPIVKEKLIRDEKTTILEEYYGDGESILIIDDEQDQREIGTNILEKLNYSSFSVSSGEEAINFLEKNKVDLILLDLFLGPEMSGLDTLREIKRVYPDLKVIIISGLLFSDIIEEAKNIGAKEFLEKPFTIDKFAITIKKELRT